MTERERGEQEVWCGPHNCPPMECFAKHHAELPQESILCTKCKHPEELHTRSFGLDRFGCTWSNGKKTEKSDSAEVACKCLSFSSPSS